MLQHVRAGDNRTVQGIDERNLPNQHRLYHSFPEFSMKGMNYVQKEPERVRLRDQAEGQSVTAMGSEGYSP